MLASLDELGTLHIHTARTARMIDDPPMMRFNNFDNQLHQCCRRKELPASLTFRSSKVAEEVFIDLSELVTFDIHRDL